VCSNRFFIVWLFLQMLFVMKCNGELASVSWTVTLCPLFVTLAGAYSYTAFICMKSAQGRYALSIAQKVALVGYAAALAALTAAVALTVYNEYMEDKIIHTVDAASYDCIGDIQYVLCTVAVSAFTMGLIVILNSEGRALARSRGFRDPLPLSHTKEGWVPTHNSGEVYTLLLGTIAVALHTAAHVGQHGANSSSLPPRSAILHIQGGGGMHPSDRPVSPQRRTQQENKDWEGEIELLLRKSSPGEV